jgi:C_GCAxxG_C_C family probable redox protein
MRMGETCGALAGAIMALGLRHGNHSRQDQAARQKVYGLVPAMTAEFKKRHGSTRCCELLGCDISTDQGMAKARKAKLFEMACPMYVISAVEIADSMMGDRSAADA